MANSVLVIDDDQNLRWVLQRSLSKAGFDVTLASSGEAGLSALARQQISLVLLDLKMPGMDGLSTLRRLKQMEPDLQVILLTAYASVPTAVEAMRLGAAEYLRKPFDVEELRFALAKALDRRQMAQEILRLSNQVKARKNFEQIIGQSPVMVDLRENLATAGDSSLNTLVLGLKGSGKTLVARSIFRASSPRETSLAEVQCKLLSPRVICRALARAEEWVEKSAILIEDVDVLNQELQEKLARALPEAGPRILATASDENLIFRDLYERVAEVTIRLSPLRERLEDIPLLANHFLGQASALTIDAKEAMQRYSWPGNVSELKSVLPGISAGSQGMIVLSTLPGYITEEVQATDESKFRLPPEGISLEEVEKQLIVQALEQAHGNKTRAAKLLGLMRHAFIYRVRKHGLV